VILAGDDFQLPSMEEGAIKILNYTEPKKKMTLAGREAFLECAKNVMSLKVPRGSMTADRTTKT